MSVSLTISVKLLNCRSQTSCVCRQLWTLRSTFSFFTFLLPLHVPMPLVAPSLPLLVSRSKTSGKILSFFFSLPTWFPLLTASLFPASSVLHLSLSLSPSLFSCSLSLCLSFHSFLIFMFTNPKLFLEVQLLSQAQGKQTQIHLRFLNLYFSHVL